jgi:hypothetical protein
MTIIVGCKIMWYALIMGAYLPSATAPGIALSPPLPGWALVIFGTSRRSVARTAHRRPR